MQYTIIHQISVTEERKWANEMRMYVLFLKNRGRQAFNLDTRRTRVPPLNTLVYRNTGKITERQRHLLWPARASVSTTLSFNSDAKNSQDACLVACYSTAGLSPMGSSNNPQHKHCYSSLHSLLKRYHRLKETDSAVEENLQ